MEENCCNSQKVAVSQQQLYQHKANVVFKTHVTNYKKHGPWRSFSAKTKKTLEELYAKLYEEEEKNNLEGVLSLVEELLQADQEHPDLIKHAFAVHITHSAKAKTAKVTVPDLREWSSFAKLASAPPSQIMKPITQDTFTDEEKLAYWREDYDYQDHHLHWHVAYPGAGVYQKGTFVPVIDRQGELFLYMHSQMVARYDCERVSWGLPVTPCFDFDDVIPYGYYPVPGLIPYYGARPANEGWYELHNPNVPDDVAPPTKNDLKLWRDNIYQAIRNKAYQTVSIVDGSPGSIELTVQNAQNLTGILVEAESKPLSTFDNFTLDRKLYGDIHDLGHDKFAEIGYKTFLSPENQMGLMTSNYGSPRDPVFYPFHRHIETYRTRVGDQFPLDLNECKPEAKISGFRIDPVGGTKLRTPVGKGVSTFLGAPNLDLLEAYAKIDHEPYVWTFHITSTRKEPPTKENPQIVTARIFLCPEELTQQRYYWIEMDKFTIELTAIRTIVSRPDVQSSVARKPPTQGSSEWCKCGWPQNMMLPAGRPEGMPTVAICMLTDDQLDITNLESPSLVFCGASVRTTYPGTYPDPRGAGYPFDRIWTEELASTKSRLQILAELPQVACYKFNIYRTTQYYVPQPPAPAPPQRVTWDVIRPYFTDMDVACMLAEYTFDFSKYDVVRIHCGMIFDSLVHKRMPKQMSPYSAQNPNPETPYWTEEQLNNFSYWMQSGCPEK